MGGISARRIKANPPISPFFKGGFKSENVFKDKLLTFSANLPLPAAAQAAATGKRMHLEKTDQDEEAKVF